jgi:hypothetical protein
MAMTIEDGAVTLKEGVSTSIMQSSATLHQSREDLQE